MTKEENNNEEEKVLPEKDILPNAPDGGWKVPEKDIPNAPDGGWGWMILLASFLFSVIVDGVCFAFGIFYLEFLKDFQETKGKTAWIGSVLNGTYMIMGKKIYFHLEAVCYTKNSTKKLTLVAARSVK